MAPDIPLLGDVLVACPHCGKRARLRMKVSVFGVPVPPCHAPPFFCSNCFKALDQRWYGDAHIQPHTLRCGYCGTFWPTGPQLLQQVRKTLTLTCQECGATRKESGFSLYPRHNSPQTQWYGLMLWLQAPVGRETLWAHTHVELGHIKTYVAAPIRNDAAYASYFDRALPAWVKSAGNRPKVLKAIAANGKNVTPSRSPGPRVTIPAQTALCPGAVLHRPVPPLFPAWRARRPALPGPDPD